MSRYILIVGLVFVLVLSIVPPACAQFGEDPGDPDWLIIDSAISFTSGIGIVPIIYVNDEELALIEVTLRHTSPEIVIDSFSFAESVFPKGFAGDVRIDNNLNTLSAVIYSIDSMLPPGSGLLGKIYFSYSQTISPQFIPIDTVTWKAGPIEFANTFRAELTSPPFVPQIKAGGLDILASPDSFDSLWIDSVGVAPGGTTAIDIHVFNERSLSKVAIALDYGSDMLDLTSVTFAGTRGEAATNRTVQPQPSLNKVYIVIDFGEAVPLDPGSGPVATLNFSVDVAAPEGRLPIDTTTMGIISDTRFTLTSLDGSMAIVPLITPGIIDVKTTTAVEDTAPDNLPSAYALAQNYPNPFNPTTNIELSLPSAGRAKIEIFNILGRKVRRLVDADFSAGVHRITFDGRSDNGSTLASGIYFYRVTAGTFEASKKMLLLK